MQNFLPVVLTEVLMTILLSYVIIYLYDRKFETTFRQRAIVALVLTMMGSMLNSLSYYIVTDKSFLNTVIAVNISMAVMSGTLIILLWKHSYDNSKRPMKSSSILTFSSLLIYNEVSMGIFAYFLGYGMVPSSLPHSILVMSMQILSLGVNSYLFIAPMVVEMCVVMILRPSHGIHKTALFALILISVFSPTLLGDNSFAQVGAFLVVIIMVLFIPLLLNKILSDSQNMETFTLLWIFPIFLLMMSGVVFGVFYTGTFSLDWAIYGVSMLLGMAFYFAYSFLVGLKAQDLRVNPSV